MGLTLCYWVIFIIILCFEPKEFVFLIKIVLHVKKEIRGSGKDHLHPRNKKQVKKLLVVKVKFSCEIIKLLVLRGNPRLL